MSKHLLSGRFSNPGLSSALPQEHTPVKRSRRPPWFVSLGAAVKRASLARHGQASIWKHFFSINLSQTPTCVSLQGYFRQAETAWAAPSWSSLRSRCDDRAPQKHLASATHSPGPLPPGSLPDPDVWLGLRAVLVPVSSPSSRGRKMVARWPHQTHKRILFGPHSVFCCNLSAVRWSKHSTSSPQSPSLPIVFHPSASHISITCLVPEAI